MCFYNREGYEFETWLNTPGWPHYTPDLSAGNVLTVPAENLADYWAEGKNEVLKLFTRNRG